MFDVGGPELLLIILAIIILFGPQKIPELAQMFGKGMRYVRKAQSQFQSQLNEIQTEIKTATNIEFPKDLNDFYTQKIQDNTLYQDPIEITHNPYEYLNQDGSEDSRHKIQDTRQEQEVRSQKSEEASIKTQDTRQEIEDRNQKIEYGSQNLNNNEEFKDKEPEIKIKKPEQHIVPREVNTKKKETE
jgi:sec-independent protein translocase protein TatA